MLLYICLSSFLFPVLSATDELVLVQAIWRHGARTPIKSYKNDAAQEKAWPLEWGQLMQHGIRQQFELGRRLRQRYIKDLGFINSNYRSTEIYIRSTDYDRTLQSALSNLAGFYSEDGDSDPRFMPVPVHSLEKDKDIFAPDDRNCTRRRQLSEQLMPKTPEYRQLMDEYSWLFAKLKEYCGEPVIFTRKEGDRKGVLQSGQLFDNFEIREENNVTLPEWFTSEIRERLTDLDLISHRWDNGKGIAPFNGTDFAHELPTLRGGPIVWKLIENMQEKKRCLSASDLPTNISSADGSENNEQSSENSMSDTVSASDKCKTANKRRYFAYSAHDNTISSVFGALGLESNVLQPTNPRYCATILFELWRRRPERDGAAAVMEQQLEPEHEVVLTNQSGIITSRLNGTTYTTASGHDEYFVKVLYWPGLGDKTHRGIPELDITSMIDGCENKSNDPQNVHCSLDKFVWRSERYRPLPSIDEACQNPSVK